MRAEGYFESSNLAFPCLLFLMFSSKFLGCRTQEFWIENTKSLRWSDVTSGLLCLRSAGDVLAIPNSGFGCNISHEANDDGFLILMSSDVF